MKMKQYEITGKYREKQDWKPYTKVLTALNEKQARERVYTVIGSKHRLKRMYIQIDAITEYQGE